MCTHTHARTHTHANENLCYLILEEKNRCIPFFCVKGVSADAKYYVDVTKKNDDFIEKQFTESYE